MSSWYYKRSIGDAGQACKLCIYSVSISLIYVQKHAEQNEAVKRYQSVGLMVGLTGIASSALADTPGGPWKIYGVASQPCPSWLAEHAVTYIQCDVANPTEECSKLSPITDITHVFYVTWTGSEGLCPELSTVQKYP
ncbi:3-oxo-Delta(4,5)-steroid 5-beta-reductase [Dorcoceras hygrometricum]|uniref:3-oxo-Delta(4,5)-steroid 5-beta-reductase n=1 Tax=Dorcoceras hygrometricum TaxID=472368 RepID=A0A2Z7DC22_9LAMI|nr:3-oxo-Delta(4,5)-steroid 5-beta-reductase [Dorcoceras hygrometricum]